MYSWHDRIVIMNWTPKVHGSIDFHGSTTIQLPGIKEMVQIWSQHTVRNDKNTHVQ